MPLEYRERDEGEARDPAGLSWFVLYTSPSGERLLAEDLAGMGYEVLYPIAKIWHRPPKHRRQRQRRLIERSLFPRYLFVGLDPAFCDLEPVLTNKRALAVLSDAFLRPVRIPWDVLEPFSTPLEAERDDGLGLRLAQLAALVGKDIRVASGPFKGLMAQIQRVTKSGVRAVVFNNQGASFKLDASPMDFDVETK